MQPHPTMHPIPVDDYQCPRYSHHYLHDIYSLCKSTNIVQMTLSVNSNTANPEKVIDTLHGCRWKRLLGRIQHGQWTFLVFLTTTNALLYHAIRGECNRAVHWIGSATQASINKNYTGEFIRAMRGVPDHLLPIGGVWLTFRSARKFLNRNCLMWYTLGTLCKKWRMTGERAYKRLFRNFSNMPTYSSTYTHLRGYDILRQCGYI